MSGPAALKLSAFGARVLNEGGYRGKLVVNWMAGNNPSKVCEAYLHPFHTDTRFCMRLVISAVAVYFVVLFFYFFGAVCKPMRPSSSSCPSSCVIFTYVFVLSSELAIHMKAVHSASRSPVICRLIHHQPTRRCSSSENTVTTHHGCRRQ